MKTTKKSTKSAAKAAKSKKAVKTPAAKVTPAKVTTVSTAKSEPKKVSVAKRKSDQYDDPNYNYLHYWDGRDYEDESERMALSRLLKGKHFKHATDIGGGYGRLCIFLEQYADKVTLAEPSQQQLDI